MNTLPPLVLASASPRRAELLRLLGLEFEVIPGNAPELAGDHLTPAEVCQINACRKARVVAKQTPDSLVIAADTEVCLGARTFGKPSDHAEAAAMLTELQGRTHQVITGVCLLHLRRHRQRVFATSTDVTFHSLTAKQIERYLKLIHPLDKAGAYAVQEHGHLVVEELEGSFSNVVGLPLTDVRDALAPFCR